MRCPLSSSCILASSPAPSGERTLKHQSFTQFAGRKHNFLREEFRRTRRPKPPAGGGVGPLLTFVPLCSREFCLLENSDFFFKQKY